MVKPLESPTGNTLVDKEATGKVKGHAFDPTDMRVCEFFIQGTSNPKDLEGIEEDQLLQIQRTIQQKRKRCRKRKKYYKEDERI